MKRWVGGVIKMEQVYIAKPGFFLYSNKGQVSRIRASETTVLRHHLLRRLQRFGYESLIICPSSFLESTIMPFGWVSVSNKGKQPGDPCVFSCGTRG